jgi:hypothetical protein
MQEYFFWRLCDYYSKWLLGDEHNSVDIIEAQRDIPETK